MPAVGSGGRKEIRLPSRHHKEENAEKSGVTIIINQQQKALIKYHSLHDTGRGYWSAEDDG